MPIGDKVEGLGIAGTPAGGVVTVQSIETGGDFPIDVQEWGSVAVAAAADDSAASYAGGAGKAGVRSSGYIFDAAAGLWRPALSGPDGAHVCNQDLARDAATPLSVGLGTHNVTNASSNQTIVAAPGANLQIRLYGLSIRLERNAAAGAWSGSIQDGAGGAALFVWSLQQPNTWWCNFSWAPFFIDLTSNTLLNSSAIGTIAGPTAVPIIAYYDVVAA